MVDFKTPSLFSWEAYLKETKAAAAPARAFKPRPPNAFRRGMKLEAIDKRSPSFLRPATVKEVKDYQIKIGFDGYPEEFGYWVDDNFTDIHPCGWGHKTGYAVTPPPSKGFTISTFFLICFVIHHVKGHTVADIYVLALQHSPVQATNQQKQPSYWSG